MKTYQLFLPFLLALGVIATASAQDKKGGKVPVIEVSARVVDESGAPIKDATIIAGEGALTNYTDASGRFKINARAGSVVLIEALGYKKANFAAGISVPDEIRLVSEPLFRGEDDLLDRADGLETYRHDLTPAIGLVNTENIRRYPDLSLTNALQGQAAGLIAIAGDGGLGNNGSTLHVRGQHASGTPAIIVVDGIERSINDLAAEEIGSIEVLKDVAAKILYGPRAANGVILINTKRGEAHKHVVRTTLEYGVTPVTRMPSYLNAHDYAQLYNEARGNDGLADYYLPYQMQGYAASTGENDLLYPNIDWYGKFTRSMGTYHKAAAEFIGGNDRVKYAVVGAYTGGSGFEAVADPTQLHRFNVRGNLDIRINDFLTVTADVAARLESRSWYGMTNSSLFSKLSTYRPNEYPFTMNAEDIGMEPNDDGSPYYGASLLHTDNVYVDMTYGGDKAERYVNTQTNFGLNFDFDKYVKGLFADAFITFDNYNLVGTAMTRTYPTWSVDGYLDESGKQQLRVVQVKKINQSDDINVSDESTTRTMGARADGGYRGRSGEHGYSAVAAFRWYRDFVLGANQDCITTNTTLRLNYDWNSRFFAEATVGVSGSNQFSKNRYIPVGSLSLGYVFSEAPFVKARASAGRMGYNPNGNYLLYKTAWSPDGNYNLGNNNNTSAHITGITRVGNEDIDWVTQSDANIGFDALLLGGKLSVQADAFLELRDNIITKLNSQYSAEIGQYLSSVNYGSVLNRGVELSLGWKDSALGGDLRYNLGGNFTFTRNKVQKVDELEGIEEYRSSIGRPSSTFFGLESEGLFGKDVALEGHAKQMYGYYGVGDVAYKDQNGDGIVDDKDNTYLGQAFPLFTFGLNADLKYKGFGLYILGTANLGQSVMLSNTYFQNTGSNAYSEYALNRYHPVNNPGGTLPRLTTTSGSNSCRDSDFWLVDGGWFRLKNVELSYTFENRSAGGFFKTCKVFARGTNLFVISGIKDLDPERLDAGVTNCPVYRTFTGGVTIGF